MAHKSVFLTQFEQWLNEYNKKKTKTKQHSATPQNN